MLAMKIHEQQKEWAIKAGVGIAVLAACYAAIISPAFQEIVDSRQRLVDSRKRLELYQDLEGYKSALQEGDGTLVTLAERSMVLGKIADIATQVQLDVDTLTPRTEPEGDYVRLKIEMDGRGSFFSLIKFLKAVERIPIPLKIKDISLLKKAGDGSSGSKYFLQIHIVFETLLKPRVKKKNV